FAGCFGETFNVLKDVGLDPTKKEYRENLDKFELRNTWVLRGDLKISDKMRQEIHHALKYDHLGNLRNPSNQKTKQNSEKREYDAFGHPIKSTTTQPNEENKPKSDAFGNPIKNYIHMKNTVLYFIFFLRARTTAN